MIMNERENRKNFSPSKETMDFLLMKSYNIIENC